MSDEIDSVGMRVLKVTSKYDDCDLWWRTDGEYAPVTFIINCNDLFFWACSDAEQVTEKNIDALEKAYEDSKKQYEHGACYAQLLFCCRERKMRPQKPYYEHIPKEMWDIFNQCGDERDD